MLTWSELNYWKSGEYQVVQEKLEEEEERGYVICPKRKDLFRSLALVPYQKVRVCIIAQDPYPNPRYATGIPLSIPEGETVFPPSLVNVFTELVDDLGIAYPGTGELSGWCKQGVLLWNVYPSVREGRGGLHHWPEWSLLTQEIVEKLDETEHVVFVLLGRCARDLRKYISRSPVIETSHPSPLGASHGFLGSRIFSQIDALITGPKIDWRL